MRFFKNVSSYFHVCFLDNQRCVFLDSWRYIIKIAAFWDALLCSVVDTNVLEKGGVGRFIRKLVFIYQNTQSDIPEDCNHHIYCHENVISHKICYSLVWIQLILSWTLVHLSGEVFTMRGVFVFGDCYFCLKLSHYSVGWGIFYCVLIYHILIFYSLLPLYYHVLMTRHRIWIYWTLKTHNYR